MTNQTAEPWTEEQFIVSGVALLVADRIQRTTGISATNTEFAAIEAAAKEVSAVLEKARLQLIRDRQHFLEMARDHEEPAR